MRLFNSIIVVPVAFLLGSATFLSSCGTNNTSGVLIESVEHTPTLTSENFTYRHSVNGKLEYIMETPLMQIYDMAAEPYREFKQGLQVETYDSTMTKVSGLTANYVIQYINKKLWEAKGDVVAVNDKGDTLLTQQLFWDEAKKKIYSNVDTKVIQKDNVMIGTEFESDDTFTDWIFKNTTGKLLVDTTRNTENNPPAPAKTEEQERPQGE